MSVTALKGGFSDTPVQAARAFRSVMSAIARPGRIEILTGAQPPSPLSVAAGTLAITLCDPETPIYLAGRLDCQSVREWISFHTGAPFSSREEATFAFGDWRALLPIDGYSIGTAEYPDRSATLIVELDNLETTGARLSGPGIKDSATLSLPVSKIFAENTVRFPLGVDFIFTCDDKVAGLPRSTKVEFD